MRRSRRFPWMVIPSGSTVERCWPGILILSLNQRINLGLFAIDGRGTKW